MRLFLDTSALIELLRNNQEVIDAIKNSESTSTSPVSLFEVLIGLSGKERKRGLPAEISALPVLPFTSRDSKRASASYGLLKNKGKLVNTLDILIAAQAAERNLTLLAADEDFDIISGIDPGLSVQQIAHK